jgi:hypothetical protein
VAGGVLSTEMVMRRLRSESGEITYISTQENITEETIPMKQILIDPFLSDNPSRDNGWSGYLTGNNSTQGGER